MDNVEFIIFVYKVCPRPGEDADMVARSRYKDVESKVVPQLVLSILYDDLVDGFFQDSLGVAQSVWEEEIHEQTVLRFFIF